jgi:uncharacterized protein
MRAVAAAALGALVVVVVAAAPASAHVEVQPSTAAAGAPATFAFRVPNEKDKASTVALTVHFPTDHAITVDVPAKAGWTANVTMVGNSVDTVTWSGGRIDPGHAEYFVVTTGPLPADVAELTFTADQTYSDGEVVSWNEPTVPGHGEPDHPAPVLELKGAVVPAATTATAAVATSVSPSSAATTAATAVTTAPTATRSDDGVPFGVVAIAALAVAAVAVGGYVMVRRTPGRQASHR